MYPKRNDKGSSLSGKEKTIARSKTLQERENPSSKGKHVVETVGQPLK